MANPLSRFSIDLSRPGLAQRLNSWLRVAVAQSNLAAAKRFLAQGADPFDTPEGSTSAFYSAARSGRVAFLRAMLGARRASPETIAEALSQVRISGLMPGLLPSAAAATSKILLAAAGEDAPHVAAAALEYRLHCGTPFDPRLSMALVDFSAPRQDGRSWLGTLAGAEFSSKAHQARVDKAFAQAWLARPPGPLPVDESGATPVHRAASSDNLRALKLMEDVADFDARTIHGLSPLDLAAARRRSGAFYFLLPRATPSVDQFGRDAFTRALLILGQTMPFGSGTLDAEQASVELAALADPWAVDALGRRFADWAQILDFPSAKLASLARARSCAPSPSPAVFSCELVDQALVDELARLGLASVFSYSVPTAEVAALGARLSNPSATGTLDAKTALELACVYGFFQLAADLTRAGASQDPCAQGSACPLATAVCCGDDRWEQPGQEAMVRLLASPRAARHLDQRGQDALGLAIAMAAPGWAIELLASMSDLDARGSGHLAAAAKARGPAFDLLWSLATSKPELAEWARPGPESSWPEALATAGKIDVLGPMLRQGDSLADDLLARRVDGASLLSWAARGSSPDALREFLPFFDPAGVDCFGIDPLMAALEAPNRAAAEFFIPLCDLSRRDALGLSALDRAKFFGHAEAQALIQVRLAAASQARALRKACLTRPTIRRPSPRI